MDAKPGELWCPTCNVKAQARTIEDRPDGTAVHTRCGKELDLVPDQPKEAAKPRRTRKKAAPRDKPARRARLADARGTPAGIRELGPLLQELERLGARPDLAVTVSWRGNSVTAHISPLEG